MSTRRASRLAQAILETVSTAVLFELRDPRIKNVTVLRVEVAPDFRSAKVIVSVRGEENVQKLSLKGLRASAGYLQSRIAARCQTRYTPLLSFKFEDEESSQAMEAARILDELASERATERRLAAERGEDVEDDSDSDELDVEDFKDDEDEDGGFGESESDDEGSSDDGEVDESR